MWVGRLGDWHQTRTISSMQTGLPGGLQHRGRQTSFLDLKGCCFIVGAVMVVVGRFAFIGVLVLALLSLGYPGLVAATTPARQMSCCQTDGTSHHDHDRSVPMRPVGSPCCPACSLPLSISTPASSPFCTLGFGRELPDLSVRAASRSERPPVPPPRRATA
jgi:hypothetical protein